MDRLTAMETFVRIVETGSFSAVARESGMTQPTISKQLTALERSLNTRLLNRSTRSISLTEAGSTYYESCRQIIDDIRAAEGDLGLLHASLSGTLNVNTSVTFGQLYLVPMALKFQKQHPEVVVDLTLNDRYVDLIEEGVDVAIRFGTLNDPKLAARRLGNTRRLTVASPAYLARCGTPLTPQELTRHNCILYSYLSTGDEWPFLGPQGWAKVKVSGNFKANNGHAIREAVLAGIGIAVAPDFTIRAELEAGQVQPLLPEYAPPPIEMNAVYPATRHISLKVRSFIEFLQREFRAIPGLAGT